MRLFHYLTAVLLMLALSRAEAGDLSPNDYVRLEVRPTPDSMRSGSNGLIELHFHPATGIHVNVDPPVAFSLDSAAAMMLIGKPAMTADSSTGYLSSTVPVTQRISLYRQSAPGQFTVKGTVTYFYCSDSEGWCNRQKEPVEFTIVVVP